MAATKDEERKVLAKIKKMVEDLGEDSYIGAAFEGCFEKAEENIDNDFACSIKQSFDAEFEKNLNLQIKIQELNEQLVMAEQKIGLLEERILMPKELDTIRSIIRNDIADSNEEMRETAKEIVEYAEKPESDEFQRAVKKNRQAKMKVEREEALLHEVGDKIEKSRK